MDNTQPLISVITPAYNAALTLQRAFDSLKAQSANWQHVIVDDGSTDDTPRVIEAIAQDPRVVTIRKKNGGIGSAHNAGLALATGEFIAFLDADDEYLPNHLSSHLKAMAEHPEVDIFWGGLEIVADSPEDIMVPDVDAGWGFISIHNCVTQGTMFARRRVFETARISEDRGIWWQDYDFIRSVRNQFKIKQFHEPTYRYYRNTGVSSVDRWKNTWPARRPAEVSPG